jgi:hypothetical protein
MNSRIPMFPYFESANDDCTSENLDEERFPNFENQEFSESLNDKLGQSVNDISLVAIGNLDNQ